MNNTDRQIRKAHETHKNVKCFCHRQTDTVCEGDNLEERLYPFGNKNYGKLPCTQ
jgi:hypothetical protein